MKYLLFAVIIAFNCSNDKINFISIEDNLATCKVLSDDGPFKYWIISVPKDTKVLNVFVRPDTIAWWLQPNWAIDKNEIRIMDGIDFTIRSTWDFKIEGLVFKNVKHY